MDPALVRRLNQINQAFYTDFAASFADTRALGQPELARVIDLVPPAGRVLDVGCGHGRIAHLLDRRTSGTTYVGLDFSAAFIRLAQERAGLLQKVQAEFEAIDLLDPQWSSRLSGRQFDIILVLAVLHHIPAYSNRLAILQRLGERLATHGRLVVSTWQFTSSVRMRRKIVRWEQVGLDPAGLEPGDHLLDWKRGGLGYRYCHLVDRAELERLVSDSGLVLVETFRAGGKEGDLSLFGILSP
jgi:tRNA (uracil-5-)-methyltransferase TRM9